MNSSSSSVSSVTSEWLERRFEAAAASRATAWTEMPRGGLVGLSTGDGAPASGSPLARYLLEGSAMPTMVLKLRLLFTAGRVGVVPALPLFLRIADGDGISMPRLLRFSGSAGRPGAVGLVLTVPPAPFMSVSQARVLSSTFSSFRYSLNTWLPCAPDPATWVNNRDIFSIVASKWVMESTSSSDDESSKLSDCFFSPDSKTPMIRSMLRRMLANTRVRGSTTSLFVTRVNSALTRTSSKTTKSVRPMLRNAVHC